MVHIIGTARVLKAFRQAMISQCNSESEIQSEVHSGVHPNRMSVTQYATLHKFLAAYHNLATKCIEYPSTDISTQPESMVKVYFSSTSRLHSMQAKRHRRTVSRRLLVLSTPLIWRIFCHHQCVLWHCQVGSLYYRPCKMLWQYKCCLGTFHRKVCRIDRNPCSNCFKSSRW